MPHRYALTCRPAAPRPHARRYAVAERLGELWEELEYDEDYPGLLPEVRCLTVFILRDQKRMVPV